MKKLIVLVSLLIFVLLIASRSSQTMLPMSSFIITTANNQDVIVVWNKVRVCLLLNGFAFLGNKNEDTKEFVLKSDQDASVILSKNAKNNFVEIVFLHLKKSEFGEEEEKTYNVLKLAVKQAVSDHNVLDSVPFRRGKPLPVQ